MPRYVNATDASARTLDIYSTLQEKVKTTEDETEEETEEED
jgi:hypothetical protein